MIKKDKVFELRIEEDDEISGIDSISLVDDPAIEVNWMFFNKVKPQEFHIPDGEDSVYLEKLISIAQDEQELLDEGWVVSKITPMGKEGFAISAPDPNGPSVENEKEYRVRYKYVLNPAAGTDPIIPTTRDFCKELVQKNYVWRLEDLDELTNDQGDPALVWRGGYNCRHLWARIEYSYDDTIRNKASVNKGKIDPQAPLDTRVLGMEQPDTTVPEWPSFNWSNLSKEGFERVSIDYDDTLSTQRGKDLARRLIKEGKELVIVTRRRDSELNDVKRVAKEVGIKKIYNTNGRLKWMKLKELGIQRHIDNSEEEIQAIKKNAPLIKTQKFEIGVPHYTKDGELYEGPTHKGPDGRLMTGAVHRPDSEYLYHEDELGYDVSTIGGYQDPGIKKKKKKKVEMESYNDYPESAKNNACKVLRWRDEHGDEVQGMTQVGWTRANQLCNGENISEETIARMASFARHRQNAEVAPEFKDTPWKDKGYVAWLGWGGTTGVEWAQNKLDSIRNNMSNQNFQIENEEKRIVVGPAMIPDLRIFRRTKDGDPYHVFFSASTIRMISEKYMRNKYIDNNDENHNGNAVKDVYVIESWIKEDEQDKSNKYGYEDLPIGTWFVSMKVKNDDIWEKVKAGDLKGFSVSGYFEEVAEFCREEMFLKQVVEILKRY